MTRRRVERKKITTNSKRNSVLRNRTQGLLKKADELSILCESNIAIVIHNPEVQNNETLWPSPDAFRSNLLKFLDFSEVEREKKMVLHDKQLQKNIEEEGEKLKNIKKRNDLKEYHNLLNELIIEGRSIDQLDSDQMKVFSSIAEEKVKELRTREEQFHVEDGLALSLAPSTLITAENLMSDSWFMDMMFD